MSGDGAAGVVTATAESAATGAARDAAAAPDTGPLFRAAPVPPPVLRLAGAAALAAGLTADTGFGGATGFGAGTDSGPNPVRTTARADAGGFWTAPSRSTGTPAVFAACNPFSTVSITGSSRRTSRKAASMSLTDAAPEERIRPASKALTAALPALRCNARRPGGPAARHDTRSADRLPPALDQSVVALCR